MDSQQRTRALELLREIDRLRRAWKLAIPNTGINKSEFFTLHTLRYPKGNPTSPPFNHEHEEDEELSPMTLSTLSKAMKQSMPAVSQRITKLEELGYVQRIQDEHDRRTVWIFLTQEGKELLHSTGEEMLGKLGHILHRLDSQEGVSAQLLVQVFHSLALAVEEEFSPTHHDG